MPRGFQQYNKKRKQKVLKLKKTIYGLRQLPKAFWKYMVEQMEECEWKQSSLDLCLFIGEKVICIIYVDDIIFWAQGESYITNLAMMLRGKGVDE